MMMVCNEYEAIVSAKKIVEVNIMNNDNKHFSNYKPFVMFIILLKILSMDLII